MLRKGSLKTSYHQYQLIGIFLFPWVVFRVFYVCLCHKFQLTGCKKELKDFSFSYSMESVDNYKLMVLFDSDKTFRIEEYNYYMDNFAKKRDPKIMEGILTDEEFASLKPIL